MKKRKIVEIDEEKCNGCGLCIPHCREGALQIVNGKAQLVSDPYCDGLGACLGYCPQGAIRIIERPAEEFDESATKAVHAHEGCPSARALSMAHTREDAVLLGNWPIQLSLVPVNAPYLKDADILLAADCVAFSLPDFHQRLLRDKILIIACPKLDDAQFYTEKLTQIMGSNNIKSLTVVHMEVPCCYGLKMIVEEALERSKKDIPVEAVVVSIDGKIKE